MIRCLIGGILGALVGGSIALFSRSRGGTCPITCNPLAGAALGFIVGALILGYWGTPVSAGDLSEHIIVPESAEAFQKTLNDHDVVVVDFYADWCGPCRRLKPTISQLADEYAGKVAVVSLNVDKHRDIAGKYGIRGIPDVRIFKGGKESEKLIGLRPKKAYTSVLDKLIEQPAKQ